jgi:pimeloyl-ACP methyl ester carboxylesterase
MSKKIKILITLPFTLSIILIPFISHAETYVHQADIQKDMVWNKAGSPYIIEEPISIPPGNSLTINEGVKVMSTLDQYSRNKGYIWSEGRITMNGTAKEPIVYLNLGQLSIVDNEAKIKHTLFDGSSLIFFNSTSTVEFSTIKGRPIGIYIAKSRVAISTSTLIDNGNYDIFVPRDYRRPFLYDTSKPDATYVEDPVESVVSIHGSRIITIPGVQPIYNDSPNRINAQNNWWGDKDGPKFISERGKVLTDPFLMEDPESVKLYMCCSNVLFIPGFEASRLYRDVKGFFGTTTNTLWEPNRNDDVLKMYMDDNGKSIDSSIYTKDIIGSIPGIKNIYQSFINSMNDMVKENAINKWLPFPYDWRHNIDDIIDDSLIEKVKELASESKSKKIVIIAHSNGGLVTKKLVKKLEEKGFGDLVENIIYIAVPELGTPEAILSMLHGHNQSLAAGAILSKNNARNFSKNLPGAYGLLPSKKFFSQNPLTVISDMFQGKTNILSFDSMKDFLLKNIFASSTIDDTSIPILLNQVLFPFAEQLHLDIDNWKPASSTKTLAVFGWGLPTSNGVLYKKDPHCNEDIQNPCALEAVQIADKSGDGTVLTKSNSNNSDSVLYFNLNKLNLDNYKNINHANILESKDLLSLIKDKITNKKSIDLDYDKYFTTVEPIDDSTTVTVRIYSPVEIDLYDSKGRHTGIKKNPNPDSDIDYMEEEIPGVYWDDFANVKSVIVPLNSDVRIELTGNDVGTFIVETELKKSNNVIDSSIFSELPITPLSRIDLIIGSSTENFGSSTIMQIDIDGDGLTDFISHTNTYLQATGTNPIKDLPTYLELMKKIIISTDLPLIQQKYWLDRLEKITKYLEKNKYKKADKYVKKILNRKNKDKKLSETQNTAILKLFEKVLNSLEYRIIDSKPLL